MWTRDSGTLARDSRHIVAFGPSSTTSRAADSLLERWFCVTAWAASTARRTVGFGEKAKARTLQKDIGMSWTDERVELLKKLWSDGLSASQIAAGKPKPMHLSNDRVARDPAKFGRDLTCRKTVRP
jgi:hypothetical protein